MNTNNTFRVSVGTEEIDRDHLTQVIVKKGLPRLTGWPGKPAQNARDGALGDGDAQHLQFAMNPWRTPQWIGHHHSRDQLANRQGRSGPASLSAMRVAQVGPKPAKPFALPAGDRVRLNIDQRIAPTGPPAAQGDPEHSIQGG
jgi:hypothetical protein